MNKVLRRPTKAPDRKGIAVYRNGWAGFKKWCEDFVNIPLYPENSEIPKWTPIHSLPKEPNPETGRSYFDMWRKQLEMIRPALAMKNGRLIHNLIVLCWPRGEGKSFLACLIQMWKFFCWPKQAIMLGANSKDQVKFVHFDIIADIIRNSPLLLSIVGRKNILEKEIRLVDKHGDIISMIRSISSFSGIVSNITGFTFSEVFEMKNPRFYAQLYGSIRNVPNALGVIDSTVSTKTHFLYKLHKTFVQGLINKKPTKHFFHYRYSSGLASEFTHPHMTQAQLDNYELTFMPGDFDRYFKNVWESSARKLFPYEYVEAMYCEGYLGGSSEDLLVALRKKKDLVDMIEKRRDSQGRDYDLDEVAKQVRKIDSKILRSYTVPGYEARISNFYNQKSVDYLSMVSERYGTDFSIHVGFDRSDPMKRELELGARTIITCCAKGLPTMNSPFLNPDNDTDKEISQKYLYLVLGVFHVQSANLPDVKEVLQGIYDEYDGIDTFCSERWGAFDLAQWLEDRDVLSEFFAPSYPIQKSIFTELYHVIRTLRIKSGPIDVPGTKGDDILREELGFFDHSDVDKWYGSPEKQDRFGIQDDCVYSLGNCLWGSRLTDSTAFRPRKGLQFFGQAIANPELRGRY